ncbi:flagellar basal body-associated FliL family protein [Acidithiobacillus sp.]|uniref:flagellar basal body-associated FliL family protein n=1 Tax=Acidithiobacillus sp. TaxID=1872118 RepID=UPI002620BDC6|nr:flagellar basal body-associated FliL family protein [Acidithiobacillus sp.]MDD2748453.1 flagellar basal body-associated FliL family protein [Acidithiobacillus sp.]MDD5278212.1 flagellar basal body-associated FliL family protein [Acidithiobacillus sp.]
MAEKAGKSKLIIMLIAVIVLLVIVGGAAVWWFMMRSTSAPTPAQIAQQQAQQKLQNTKFIDLGSLVTNLQSADGNTHYIQVQIQLKTYEPSVEASVKSYMPEIRNGILLLLSAQNADTVSQPAMRDQLLQKIREQVNKVLETDGGALAKSVPEKNPPIAAVYFASFVVQ